MKSVILSKEKNMMMGIHEINKNVGVNKSIEIEINRVIQHVQTIMFKYFQILVLEIYFKYNLFSFTFKNVINCNLRNKKIKV